MKDRAEINITKSFKIYSNKKYLENSVSFVLLAIGSIIMLIPIFWMLSTAFKESGQIWSVPPVWIPIPVVLDNFRDVFEILPVDKLFSNSVMVSVITTIIQLMTSCMGAYAFARLKFRGKNLIFLFFMASMMIPRYILTIPLFLIFNQLKLGNTMPALILPGCVSAFSIFLLRQFIEELPAEFDEAATIDGASRWKILFRIIIPLAKPGIMTLIIFAFMNVWNDFFWPLVIINDTKKMTLQVGMAFYMGAKKVEWGPIMALASCCSVPIMLLYLFAQKSFMAGITAGGVKG